jgi:predicted nucleic acid-binding protein
MISIPNNQKIKIFDTTVFIDYLRGRSEVIPLIQDVLDRRINPAISIITVVELWAGVKDAKDEKRHKALLSPFRRIQIHSAIAYRAGAMAYSFYKNGDKSISLPDFIIAATAEYLKADIVTRNGKHFQKLALKDVNLILYQLN